MSMAWKLTTLVERDKEFDLSASWSLGTAADDWLWTDFLDDPDYISPRKSLSGQLTTEHNLQGKYEPDKELQGQLTTEHNLEGEG